MVPPGAIEAYRKSIESHVTQCEVKYMPIYLFLYASVVKIVVCAFAIILIICLSFNMMHFSFPENWQ